MRRIGPSWSATFLFLLLSVLLPAMRMLQDLLGYFLGNPLELAGLVSGLLCVGLLAKQSFWTWPIGLFYSTVSVFVFFGDHLFASMLESVYYIGLNAYGWYFWLRGAGARGDDDSLLVIRMPTRYWIPVIAIALIGGAAVGALFNQYTEAALPFWDGGSMWLAFIAMWMAARKWLESWILWFIVDVAKTVIYTVQEIEPYAVLYSVYLIMAVWGWRIWRRSMAEERS